MAAMLMVPVGIAHAFAKRRLARRPELAVSAALVGALAGLVQAMGLPRWVAGLALGVIAVGAMEGPVPALGGAGQGQLLPVIRRWACG